MPEELVEALDAIDFGAWDLKVRGYRYPADMMAYEATTVSGHDSGETSVVDYITELLSPLGFELVRFQDGALAWIRPTPFAQVHWEQNPQVHTAKWTK
tara:strand:+ start:29 stop:322 length:294 start_codon:yes stop_codon:yes gene_type:complete